MRVGTKSLLFGGHQFLVHPSFVVVAWVRLYRGPPNPKELVCIIIHDWGYWGKPNMDGEEGELHPLWGARVASRLLGKEYYGLTAYHSRSMARRDEAPLSRLCLADKLGVAMMPTWLWVLLTRLSGEVHEYMSHRKYETPSHNHSSPSEFFHSYRRMVAKWVENSDVTIGKFDLGH